MGNNTDKIANLESQMKHAIKNYYRRYKINFWEKRALKQEEDFLHKIKIRIDTLR